LIALLWAFFIPSVERSLYFHQKENEIHHQNRFHQAFQLIREHFINSFKNHTVIIWSIYYAITVCFYNQIIAYIQVLWITIDDTQKYNGYVDAILTSSSAIFSLLAGKIHINFLKNQNHALLVLIMMSSLQGIFVIFASMSQSLIACYIYYICYGISYAFGITICATEIASNLPQDTYGLIFGFNTLIGLIIQTIVTYTFVSSGFLLPPREQYEIYSYFFFGLAVIFIIIFIARKFKKL
jgi:solute carrier family 19 (thiamine transporter), member 2/3